VLSLRLADQELRSLRPQDEPARIRAVCKIEYHGIEIAGVTLVQHPTYWRIGSPSRPNRDDRERPVTIAGETARNEIFRSIAAAYSAMTGTVPPSSSLSAPQE
jgi:hypothetical protein